MSPELRNNIILFNKERLENSEKASDLMVIINALSKISPCKLNSLFDDDVIVLLSKYGIEL